MGIFRKKKRYDDLNQFDINSAPMEELLKHFYSVWEALNVRISQKNPNMKAKTETPFSFANFILATIVKENPISVLDLGSNNCFLSYTISNLVHPGSQFSCIDLETTQPLYVTKNVNFQQIDIFEYINLNKRIQCDYIILGAILALFDSNKQKLLLDFARKSSRFLYIREVPKLTNLVDVYSENDLVKFRGWNNFTEHELRNLLKQNSFEILKLEHEYDIYILAQDRI
jgi:hypothetical protein